MNSSELKGYLTGLILGDGYIDNGITKRAFAIKSIQKDFLDKIKEDLESCSSFDINIKYTPEHVSGGCHHKESWELRIKAHPYFNKKYHHFYDDYKHRHVTREALDWLTPNGLANWYMSDGYVCLVGKESGNIYNRRVDICTDRYDLKSIKIMQEGLYKNFGIVTTLNKRGRFYRIRIKSESYQDFIDIIRPYIVPSMLYKLYLGYPKKPKKFSDEAWKFQENLRSAIALTDNAEG